MFVETQNSEIKVLKLMLTEPKAALMTSARNFKHWTPMSY
jgi:hypothetical protein